MINKKNNTGDWEHKDKQWYFTEEGYIQDQNSSLVLGLMDGGTASGTKVVLNASDSMKWVKEVVDEDQWFHLKPVNLEKFLTAEDNDLTTVTGTNYSFCY